MRIIKQTYSPKQTMELATIIGQNAPQGTIIAAYGDLAHGKTVFAKGLAKGLGIEQNINSPTYIYYQDYMGKLPFCHIDAYRLEDWPEEELIELGLDDCFADAKVTFVEWPQFLADYLPSEHIKLIFSLIENEDQHRQLIFEFEVKNYPWLLELLSSEITKI